MGNKKPRFRQNPKAGRFPTFNQQVALDRQPKVAADPELYWRKHPSWRLSQAEMCEPWGWHQLTQEQAAYVKDKLVTFESRTWAEILIDAKKQNHHIDIDDLCKAAQDRLTELKILVDQVVSLRLSGEERVIGLLEGGVFSVLWWDPNHEVCPSKKKNT